MKRRFFILLLTTILAMFVGAQTAKPADEKSKAILQLLEDWDNAYIKKDAAPLLKLLSDDYIGIDENGDVTRKADEIASIKSGEYVIHSVKNIEPTEIRFYGSVAIATTFSTVNQTYKGVTSEFKARATTVCAEKDGQWMVVSWHGSKVTEK